MKKEKGISDLQKVVSLIEKNGYHVFFAKKLTGSELKSKPFGTIKLTLVPESYLKSRNLA
ncbi:MAG: hypothetical protein FWC36_00325 [Spirochaetes bacterium]|nr:hypothetical protein [Spirochaetota bacterium]